MVMMMGIKQLDEPCALVEKVQTSIGETPSKKLSQEANVANCHVQSLIKLIFKYKLNASKLKSGPQVKVAFVQIKAVFVNASKIYFMYFKS